MHKIISEKSWLGININAFTHSMGGLKSMYKKILQFINVKN